MFTGIIQGVGQVAALDRSGSETTRELDLMRRVDGVTRQSQTRYNIRLDDPLTSGDANALPEPGGGAGGVTACPGCRRSSPGRAPGRW